ncbi:unnamed protein product [Penicillium discolor]
MRTIWKGALTFGLVNVPVKVYSATEDHDVPLHQVHDKDGGRIRYQRTCEVCGETVAYSDIDRAYVDDGQTVVLTKDDLAALPAEKSREIDVVEFVPSEQVDPLTLDKPYYLEPDSKSPKAYVLLRKTLEQTDRTAIVRFTLRQKTRLAALRVRGKVLVLQTLLWSDEVREAEFPSLDEDVRISKKELELSSSLVDSYSADFDPEEFVDEYRGHVGGPVEHVGVEDEFLRLLVVGHDVFACGRGLLRLVALGEVVPQGDDRRTADGDEQDDVDVLDDEVPDPRDVGDEVADHREPEAPDHRSDEVVERVAPPRHVAHAGRDRSERAHDRHEAREDHGEAAEALEERVGALDVLLAEQARFLAFEHRGAALVPDDVAELAPDERREGDEQGDDPDVHAEDVARVGQQARDDEQRVTGQEEADQQTGLGEDDEADHEERPRTRRPDDRLRIEPRDERGGGVQHAFEHWRDSRRS